MTSRARPIVCGIRPAELPEQFNSNEGRETADIIGAEMETAELAAEQFKSNEGRETAEQFKSNEGRETADIIGAATIIQPSSLGTVQDRML